MRERDSFIKDPTCIRNPREGFDGFIDQKAGWIDKGSIIARKRGKGG